MTKIGAYATIRWNDTGDEVSGCLFSLETYNATIQATNSGIDDSNVFFYCDSEEQLLAMVNPADTESEFTILTIDDWVKSDWEDSDEVTTTFGTIQQVKEEQYRLGFREANDQILDALEDLAIGHPLPKTKDCCEYCLTWLVVMELLGCE